MTEVATDQDQTPARPFDDESARAAMDEACVRVGLGRRSAELVRIGSNAVYRLDGQLIARVAPTTSLLHNARKQIDVARWLDAMDYPVTRAVPVEQPVEADGRVVTFWQSISRKEVYAPLHDVGTLIRRLHRMAAPPGLCLPELCPFGSPEAGLPAFAGLSADDRSFLHSRIEWARGAFADLPFILESGPVHGDANVGNVICDDEGNAFLIDLDSFATGPREWDLIQTALFYDRLGWHSESEYREFVDAYGYDILSWDSYPILADMREIAMTSWMARQAEVSTDAAAETAKRIAAIRTGSSRRDWGAR